MRPGHWGRHQQPTSMPFRRAVALLRTKPTSLFMIRSMCVLKSCPREPQRILVNTCGTNTPGGNKLRNHRPW